MKNNRDNRTYALHWRTDMNVEQKHYGANTKVKAKGKEKEKTQRAFIIRRLRSNLSVPAGHGVQTNHETPTSVLCNNGTGFSASQRVKWKAGSMVFNITGEDETMTYLGAA